MAASGGSQLLRRGLAGGRENDTMINLVTRQISEGRNTRITLDEYRALAEFRYQVRLFLCFSERHARQASIHPQQHRLLLAIKGMPGGLTASIRNLAHRLQIEHHSAVELIDRAAARGLVVRRPDPKDGRVVRVEITAKGEKILAQLSLRNKEELRSAAPALVRALRLLTRGKSR
jgi:DNA-binding MarR family transcriptional regulator